jgi:hypothetical protein
MIAGRTFALFLGGSAVSCSIMPLSHNHASIKVKAHRNKAGAVSSATLPLAFDHR